MSLRTFVKIGSVNNLSDARYCAGMAVDLIGFNIDPDIDNYLTPDSFREITEWISGIEFVGEFEMDNTRKILDVVKNYQIDYIQVCHLQLLDELSLCGLPVILKIDLGKYTDQTQFKEDLNFARSMVSFFVIEGHSDTIKTEALYLLSTDFPFLIGTGISSRNVNELIDNFPINGISLKGGDEIKPGYKDYDELSDILEAIEVEDFS
ncbi:N-(5'-phosphoribosyl)anthranilate isomerase [Bacteroidota bacterium]